MDEARVCERVAALTWEMEKTTAHHLEQQLPQDDDDNHSIDVGSILDAALTLHLHAQAADICNTLFSRKNKTLGDYLFK
jgi:hypothetical protein